MDKSLTTGPARERLRVLDRADNERLRKLAAGNSLILDDRRRRPLYFDGRFLAARDLTREQNYFLTRQADLGRAGGTGVVAGLEVALAAGGRRLHVRAGHGITPSGESVVLLEDLDLDLADVADAERLDAAFGLSRRPAPPARARTGLFVVALRNVEFTGNPIASYPTTVGGTRSVEDGDIIEGVAATLIPYPDPAGGDTAGQRSRIARGLFVEASLGGLPVDALPLAMLSLERNTIRWLDQFMVRRKIGADTGDVLGLGLKPRALREAYLEQYDRQLADVLSERDAGNRGRRFTAAEHFLALPPAGRMPVQAIDASDFTQTFFPPEMRVDLSFVPEDEVPALLDESLLLPPIDLVQDAEALAATSVLVVIPVPIERARALRSSLDDVTRLLRPAAPGQLAQRKPVEALRRFRLPRTVALPLRPADVVDQAWAAQLAAVASTGDGMLWFVRRRNIDYRSDVVGEAVRVAGDESGLEDRAVEAMRPHGLITRARTLEGSASALARGNLVALIAAPGATTSPALANAMITEMEAAKTAAEVPDANGVVPAQPISRAVLAPFVARFSAPGTGDGMKRLEVVDAAFRDDRAVFMGIAQSGLATRIDRVASTALDPDLPELARGIADAARNSDPAAMELALMKADPEGRSL